MGTFNFSNMQGGQQQETQNIPREFRPAVEQAKTEPVGSYGNNKTGFWDGVKNFFSGADVDTSAGFIDETGTWNNGTKQELAKYYPTQKSAEDLEKDRLGSLWDRTYKKYHYSKDDVLLEAKKISAATNIPENAILANADNLANARNVYNYQQKAMVPQAVFKAYPELSELAKLSDTDAAIALHNLKNVRQTQGIIEAAKTGWELDNLMSERGRMGYAAMNGKELTDADIARLGEIEKAQKNSKELPGLFEDPMSAIVGGTVQSGKMMLRNALNGQKMGVYGAGFGALLGGIAGGGTTLGAGTAAGAAAGAKIGYSVGSRIGMAQDMYDEIAGNNYLDYRGYKDKHGRQLLTDNQARSYAAVAAALETGIEFSNADKILNVIKGGAGAQSIKEIISSAKDSAELQSLLAAYLRDSAKNIGTVAISESAEEGVQEMSNRIISDIAAANNPGGDIPTYTAKDVIVGGLEASWQALPASIGFGAGAHGASTVSFMRRASAALQLKSEEQKANLRDANGMSMLRSLAEDIKNNALFKKAPEVYNEVLNNQLKGTELETINIDTEYVLNQQGGYELLKSAAKAAGIGEQYLKDIIDTKADLKISTADYVSKLLPTEIGAHLEDYITFSDISECLARNREYAGRMRREMDRILAYENRQREDALNTYLDNNFHTPETREIAEAVLRRFPDNPKEGVKEIRKSLQAKIDEPLNQIIEELEKGMGNGVAVVEIPEYDNQMRGRGIKVSNNDPWYQRYYKENKHKPSKMELRELAREIWTGHNEYGLFGWENRTPEDNQWYENNKAAMEATEEAIRRLDALTPALEKIDPGELSITEGLSEEGFEVYRKLRGKLEGAESKEVRQAAQMSAILAARMADRMAELHRQVGHTKYTALDYARTIGLIRSESEAAEQKFNQAVNVGIDLSKRYEAINLDELIDSVGDNSIHPDAIDKTINYIKNVLSTSEPVTTEDLRAVFDFSKIKDDYYSHHIVLAKSQNRRNNNQNRRVRNISISNPKEVLRRAILVEIAPTEHSKGKYFKEDTEDSFTYRFVMPVILNKRPRVLVINAIGNSLDILQNLNEVTLYEIRENKIPSSQAKDGLTYDGISGETNNSSAFSITEMLAKVKDLYGDPYIDENTGKLRIEDQMAIGSMKLDQKAWHGTPYDFERFDIGKIGDGVGDQVHGWGLYFAKDRKISEAYKEVLGADAGAVIVDGVTYKIDEEGDWATAAGQKLIDNDPLEFVLDTFDAMTGNKNKERAIKSLKERIAGTKRTANTKSYIAKLEEAINIIEKADVKYENTSRLLKVEVPENDVLLDEQKTFINQNKNVQALLKKTIESLNESQSTKFWEDLLKFKLRAYGKANEVQSKIDGFNVLADKFEKFTENKPNTFGYRFFARSLGRHGYSEEEIEKLKSDGEYRKREQEKLRSQAIALEAELEQAKAEDAAERAEVIKQAKADIPGTLGGMFSGNKIYDALAKAMGEEDYNWRGASELLNEHGIKGIAYEGMKDGRCFVVFDDKSIDIIERYNQSAGERAMTANMEKLKEAKEMLAKAADMKTIYQKTGWHRGADGKWRFEIPDNLDKIDAAKFPEEGYAIPLGEIYTNPKLYEAYPWLADVMVQSEAMEEQTLGVAAGEGYIGINSNLLGDGIKQEIIINGIKYKRVVSKDGAKAGKFFSHGDEFIEYALNHGIKNNTFDKKAAVNSLKELIQEKESVIEKLKSKNNNGQFNKGILDRQKELSKIREAAEFVGRADISFKVYLMQDDGTALATSDYQLDMDARQITYPSSGTALPEGKKLVIMRELPLQQMMNLLNNGPYFAEDVETAFDENVMAMQQIAEKLNRSIIMSVDIDGDAFVNEVPFEAGKSFRIADDGKSIVLTEDPGKVIDEAKGLLAETTIKAEETATNAQEAKQAAAEIKTIYNSGGLTPITDLAGSIGTAIKRWGYIFANKVFAMNLPIVYKSVAEMKADSLLFAGMTACTLGYYSPNDGGAGTYIIRAKQASDVDDGGSVHELANGCVAELVVENGTVNVKQFGAKGDGVADDTERIQRAVDYCESLYLPNATYMINNDGIHLHSNISFILSSNAVLKKISEASVTKEKSIIYCDNCTNVSISGGELVGDLERHIDTLKIDSEYWCHGINVAYSSNLRLSNIHIHHCIGDGIRMGSPYGKCTDVCVENCNIHNCQRHGVSCVAKNFILRNTEIYDIYWLDGIDVESDAVDVALNENITIENCRFYMLNNVRKKGNIDINVFKANNVKIIGCTTDEILIVMQGSISIIDSDILMFLQNENTGNTIIDNCKIKYVSCWWYAKNMNINSSIIKKITADKIHDATYTETVDISIKNSSVYFDENFYMTTINSIAILDCTIYTNAPFNAFTKSLCVFKNNMIVHIGDDSGNTTYSSIFLDAEVILFVGNTLDLTRIKTTTANGMIRLRGNSYVINNSIIANGAIGGVYNGNALRLDADKKTVSYVVGNNFPSYNSLAYITKSQTLNSANNVLAGDLKQANTIN